GLHGSKHAKPGKTRKIGRRKHFYMLDTVAAVAASIGALRRLIAVERPVDRRITDGVHRDLEAEAVGFHANGVELVLLEEGIAPDARMRVIIREHVGRGGFNHAI